MSGVPASTAIGAVTRFRFSARAAHLFRSVNVPGTRHSGSASYTMWLWSSIRRKNGAARLDHLSRIEAGRRWLVALLNRYDGALRDVDDAVLDHAAGGVHRDNAAGECQRRSIHRIDDAVRIGHRVFVFGIVTVIVRRFAAPVPVRVAHPSLPRIQSGMPGGRSYSGISASSESLIVLP